MAQVSKIMPREGVGVALGARVGHVVTYRGSPEVSLIYTVFTKKCQKRSKRGYPLFLTRFREIAGTRVPPTPGRPLGGPERPDFAIAAGRFQQFLRFFRGGGYQVPAIFKKYHI